MVLGVYNFGQGVRIGVQSVGGHNQGTHLLSEREFHLTPLERAPRVYPNPPLPIPDVFLELETLLDVVSAP